MLSGDRVFVGVGAGERLNEQAFGGRWPSVGERRARLEEAIGILRDLWAGKLVSRRGDHFAVEHLQLWTRPATPPPLFVAASGVRSAELAGRVGDGLIAVTPDRRIVEVFRGSGGEGKPCIGQLHISLAATIDSAVEQAWEWWPHGVVPPALLSELARPTDFEVTAQAIGRDRIGDTVVCATDAAPIHAAIARFAGAGFDTVYLHQVGPDQDRLVRLARDELLTERQAGTRNGSSGRVRVKSAISAAWSDGRSIPRSM